MKSRLIVLIPVAVSLWAVACRSSSGPEPSAGKKDTLAEKPDTCVRDFYDKKGNLYSKVTMKNNVPNGPSVSFYSDGTKNTEVNYVDGKKHGIEKKYYGTGEVYRERSYEMGIQHGWERRYYKSGQLMSEVYFHQGMISNVISEFDHEGDPEKIYPSIVFRVVRNRNYEGQRLLVIQLSNHSSRATFYPGRLLEGKYLPADRPPLGGKKGTGEIPLSTSQTGTRIDIVAKYITPRNTPCLIEGSWVVTE
ncbi:MAG: toxin-antitoxin system YwqK family antitoxin [Bacteroidales bacterium]